MRPSHFVQRRDFFSLLILLLREKSIPALARCCLCLDGTGRTDQSNYHYQISLIASPEMQCHCDESFWHHSVALSSLSVAIS